MQNDISSAAAPLSPENHVDIADAARHLGLTPVRAWVPNTSRKPRSSGAERTKRSREKAEQQGLKQLSVLLRVDLHELVKSLAVRSRGEESAPELWAALSPTQAHAPSPPSPPSVPSPPPAQAKLHGWRRWLLRWLLPPELKALIG